MLYFIGKVLSWLLFKIFGHLKVIGHENIPLSGGVVLTANHTSYADPPLVGLSCSPRGVWFMAKEELFVNPVMKNILSKIHAFPIKRASVDRQALRRAHELLTSGKAVTIFFEGRRSRDGRLQLPELGTAMIALRANVPIVPMALINSDLLLPRKGGIKFTRITVAIGEPLYFPHLAGKSGDREALREVSESIARQVARLMRENGAAKRVPDKYLEESL